MHASTAAAARQRRRVQTRIDNADGYRFFSLLTGPRLLDGGGIAAPQAPRAAVSAHRTPAIYRELWALKEGRWLDLHQRAD